MEDIRKFRMTMLDFNEEDNYEKWVPYNGWITLEEYHNLQEHKFFNSWKWDLKSGDKVKCFIGDSFEEIREIIYDNDLDHRNIDGGLSRVTINGLHWYIDDIKEAIINGNIKKHNSTPIEI